MWKGFRSDGGVGCLVRGGGSFLTWQFGVLRVAVLMWQRGVLFMAVVLSNKDQEGA